MPALRHTAAFAPRDFSSRPSLRSSSGRSRIGSCPPAAAIDGGPHQIERADADGRPAAGIGHLPGAGEQQEEDRERAHRPPQDRRRRRDARHDGQVVHLVLNDEPHRAGQRAGRKHDVPVREEQVLAARLGRAGMHRVRLPEPSAWQRRHVDDLQPAVRTRHLLGKRARRIGRSVVHQHDLESRVRLRQQRRQRRRQVLGLLTGGDHH
jgi:hypothetical protein